MSDYLNKVQLTADDLLKALPYKLQKGFYKEGSMGAKEYHIRVVADKPKQAVIEEQVRLFIDWLNDINDHKEVCVGLYIKEIDTKKDGYLWGAK